MKYFYRPLINNGQDFCSALLCTLLFTRGVKHTNPSDEVIPIWDNIPQWQNISYMYDRFFPTDNSTYGAISGLDVAKQLFKDLPDYIANDPDHTLVESSVDFSNYSPSNFVSLQNEVHNFLVNPPADYNSITTWNDIVQKSYYVFLMFGWEGLHTGSALWNPTTAWSQYVVALRDSWEKLGLSIEDTIINQSNDFLNTKGLNEDYTTLYLNLGSMVRNSYDTNSSYDTEELNWRISKYNGSEKFNPEKDPSQAWDSPSINVDKKQRFISVVEKVADKIKEINNHKVVFIGDDWQWVRDCDTNIEGPSLRTRLDGYTIYDYFSDCLGVPRQNHVGHEIRSNSMKENNLTWLIDIFKVMIGESLIMSKSKDVIFTKTLYPIIGNSVITPQYRQPNMHYIDVEPNKEWQTGYSDFVVKTENFAVLTKQHNDLFLAKHNEIFDYTCTHEMHLSDWKAGQPVIRHWMETETYEDEGENILGVVNVRDQPQ